MEERRGFWSRHWPIFAIAALALVLRVMFLEQRCIWLDELESTETSSSSFERIVFRSFGPFPIARFYFIALRAWRMIIDTEAWMRMFSAFTGVGLVVTGYALSMRLFNRGAAILTAFMLATSPFLVYYSQEIRMYMLVTLLGVLSTYCFVRVLGDDRRWWHWVGYVVSSALALHTHNFAVFLVFSQNLYFAMYFRRYRRILAGWLVATVVVLKLYSPEIYRSINFLIRRGGTRAISWVSDTDPKKSVAATGYAYSMGMAVVPTKWNMPIVALGVGVYGVGLVLGTIHARRWRALLLVHLIAPLALCMLISLRWSIYSHLTPRYLLIYTTFFFLLAGAGIALARLRWLTTALVAGLLIVNGVSLYHYYADWDYIGMGRFREAAYHIRDHFQEGDATLVMWLKTGKPIAHYFPEMLKSRDRSELRSQVLGREGLSRADRVLQKSSRVWLINQTDLSMADIWRGRTRTIGDDRIDSIMEELGERGYLSVPELTKVFKGRKAISVYLFENTRYSPPEDKQSGEG